MSLTSRRSKRWIATATAALSALSIASSANAAAPGALDLPGNIIYRGDYNTGDLSQWNGNQRTDPYSIQLVKSPLREGAFAARYEVRNGDDPLCQNGWGCYGDRAEVQHSTGEKEGMERWYSWSTMFDPSYPSSSRWQVVGQWHSSQNGSPPMGMYVEGDTWVLKFHRFASPGNLLNIVNVWRGPLRRGEWQDVRMRVKWSGSDSVGFVEMWLDGVPQKFDNGSTRRYIRNMYPGYGNYFKQGIYRQSGESRAAIVYHDGFRISDGQGTLPPPPPPPSGTNPPPPSPTEPAPAPAPSVAITPSTASVAAGTTKQFTATVANTTGGVNWSVNGIAGGDGTVGTISSTGLYTAPAAVPAGGTVTVRATSVASPSATATATVTVTAPVPPPPSTDPAPAPVDGTTLFSDGFEQASPAATGSPWTLRVDSGNNFAWSTLYKASGTRSTAFQQASSTGRVAYITRAVPTGKSDVSVTARVYLRSNTLANNHSRVLVRVTRGDGRVRGPRHELGVHRTSSGALRWAVWGVNKDGVYSPMTLGSQVPATGQWHTVTLRTQWNRADARARVGIAGSEAFSSAAVNLTGVTPTNVDVGNVWSPSADKAIVYFDDVTVTDAGIPATTAGRVRATRAKVPASSRVPFKRVARR